MLQNAYFLAKIGADTAENEQHFAEILPIASLGAPPAREAVPRVARRPPHSVAGGARRGHVSLASLYHRNHGA